MVLKLLKLLGLVVEVKSCGGYFIYTRWGPLVPAGQRLNTTACQCCYWPCPPLYDLSVPIFQDKAHHEFIVTPSVNRSNSAPLGCGGIEGLHHWWAADSNCVTPLCQYHLKISEGCFQHLAESVPQRVQTVLKEKGWGKLCTVRYT